MSNFFIKPYRGISRGVLLDYIKYAALKPYVVLSSTKKNILIKIRHRNVLYELPKGDLLPDYIYSASPITELSIRPFFNVKGGVFIDIGSFIGKYSMDVALQNKKNRIISVEPNPVSFKILKRNVLLNKVKNVTLVNEAISDKKGKISFVLSGSASKPVERNSKNAVLVKSGTLYDLIIRQNVNLSDIKLIKIDVEGYEKVILEQICKLSKQLKSARIICEILSDDKDKKNKIKLMKDYGFKVKQLDEINYCFFKRKPVE